MERGHRAQWASGEPPAKPSGLKRARPTTNGNFLNRLLRGLKRARPTTHGNFLNRLLDPNLRPVAVCPHTAVRLVRAVHRLAAQRAARAAGGDDLGDVAA